MGSTIPAFEATALSGRSLRIPGDYRDKILLVEFWATWCAPCRAAIPKLVELHEQWGSRGLVIVGVSLDGEQNVSQSRVAEFVREHQMTWEQVYDREDAAVLAAAFGVRAIPEAFLIDGASGRILAAGAELQGARLPTTVGRHLRAPGARATP